MTETKRRNADEILRALTELLIEYHQQDAEGNEFAEDCEHVGLPQHQQATLPLQTADANGAAREADTPPPADDIAKKSAAPAPWAQYVDGDLTKKKTTSLIMSPTLHAKMQWVVNNVPKISQQKLIQAGAEAEADRLIALYHKPI